MKLAAAAAVCDLCHHHQPTLYCSSDSAFLCFECDSQVHTANFLVARHIRVPICKSECQDDDDDAMSSSSSSSSSSNVCCISSKSKTTSTSTSTSADWKTRDVLVSWCSRVGGSNMRKVIEVARHGFQVWWMNSNRKGPYRVGLAASLWLGLTKGDNNIMMNKRITLLKRLEEISGVPAKSIVLQQSKLAATLKHHRHQHQQESWGEC